MPIPPEPRKSDHPKAPPAEAVTEVKPATVELPAEGMAALQAYHEHGTHEAEALAFLRKYGGHPIVISGHPDHIPGDQRTTSYAYSARKGRIVREVLDLEAQRNALKPRLPKKARPDADD